MDAVRTDENVTRERLAVPRLYHDAIGGRDDLLHALPREDLVLVLDIGIQDAVQILPLHEDHGIPVAVREKSASGALGWYIQSGLSPCDQVLHVAHRLLPGHARRLPQAHDLGRPVGRLDDVLVAAQLVQDTERRAHERDGRSNGRRDDTAFKHDVVDARRLERDGRGQTREAGAYDDDPEWLFRHCQCTIP